MRARISEAGVIEDRELAEYYSLMAKRYMGIPCRRVLSRIKAKGIERGKALDVGTGPGIFPIFLSRALPEIEFKAIDLSPTMVEIARQNAMEAGIGSGIDFQIGSAYALPCEDHSLDLLLCINTLHHLDRPVEFFNEVARGLKEGGGFVIVDFHRDTSLPLLRFSIFSGKFISEGIPRPEGASWNRCPPRIRWRSAGTFWSIQSWEIGDFIPGLWRCGLSQREDDSIF